MTLTGIIQQVFRWLHIPQTIVQPAVMVVAALIILGFILFVVLYLIYGLRKIMGWIQARIGPNRVGPYGLAQTIADAVKLLTKEDIIPCLADKWAFIAAPIIVFVPAYLVYVVIPFGGKGWIAQDLSIGILYVAAVMSMPIIGIITAGWASNNKWSLLGAFRAAAQIVSYEIPLILAMIPPVMLAGTLSLQGIVHAQEGSPWLGVFPRWFIVSQIVGFAIYMCAALAESNLTPFDIMEAESELVAGFNTEYSGMKFALFFLAEFAGMFTISAIAATLFFGGWLPITPALKMIPGVVWFLGKTAVIVFVLMWIRSTLPRIRVDQLMSFGWKVLIPIALLNIAWTGFLVLVS
ncbi:MAG TPA: NADH-quinone oxidoreductase subunit NuoH [Armatimonadota bacterium]|nr:NADH-quinone oxidoreductase subunit NuoH [Armatimonadota bacterium]